MTNVLPNRSSIEPAAPRTGEEAREGTEPVNTGLVLLLRIVGALVGTAAVAATLILMNDLPWFADALLALAACTAFAFWFERADSQ